MQVSKSSLRFRHALLGLLVLAVVVGPAAAQRREWNETQRANTIDAYEAFSARFRDSKFADEARARLELLYFQKAKTDNTVGGYAEYLARFGEGKFGAEVPDAAKAIARLLKEDESFKNYTVSPPAPVQLNAVSLRLLGGLKTFTLCRDGNVGDVEMSQMETEAAKTALRRRLAEDLPPNLKVADDADLVMLVRCPEHTYARLGGGAIWQVVGSYHNEDDVRQKGVRMGHCSMQAEAEAQLVLVRPKDKLVLLGKRFVVDGTTLDGFMNNFVNQWKEQVAGLLQGK